MSAGSASSQISRSTAVANWPWPSVKLKVSVRPPTPRTDRGSHSAARGAPARGPPAASRSATGASSRATSSSVSSARPAVPGSPRPHSGPDGWMSKASRRRSSSVHGGDPKVAAAAVETRKIAGREPRPVRALHPPREHRVEHQGARGREREAALGAARRPPAALHPVGDPIEIVAVAAEALRAEIIRRAVRAQRVELLFEWLARPGDLAQADAEAVAATARRAFSLRVLACALEHTELVRVHRRSRIPRTCEPPAR